MLICENATKYQYTGTNVGRLAQLVRVLPSHGRGRGFESRSAHCVMCQIFWDK